MITLDLAGGGSRTLTRDQALAATESELTPVGRLHAGLHRTDHRRRHALSSFDTRLRETTRSTNTATTGPTVDDTSASWSTIWSTTPTSRPHQHDTDGADMDLVATGIGLEVTKTITPDTQTEPDHSPVTSPSPASRRDRHGRTGCSSPTRTTPSSTSTTSSPSVRSPSPRRSTGSRWTPTSAARSPRSAAAVSRTGGDWVKGRRERHWRCPPG